MNDDPLDDIKTEIDSIKLRVSALEKACEGLTLMQETLNTIQDQNTRIMVWVAGTDKVLGFTRKHWRTAFKVGLGFVIATGWGNPHVQFVLSVLGRAFGF